jgi:coenzyme F420-reducing hydrogenase alpha subunit
MEHHEEIMKRFVKKSLEKLNQVESLIKSYPNGNKYFAAVVNGKDVDYYKGNLRIVDTKGNVVKEVEPLNYQDAIKEHSFEWTYIKPVTIKEEEYPEGAIRSGPIARINITDKLGTPWADELLEAFRSKFGRYAWDPLLYHEARVIESVHMFELLKDLLESPELMEGPYLVDTNDMKNERGVGLTEAPRGILIHDVVAYQPDDEVKVKKFNIITPTALNAAAIENDLRVSLVGKNVNEIEKELYAMVSSVVRSYDPCMACATHSVSKGPALAVKIVERGKVVKVIKG